MANPTFIGPATGGKIFYAGEVTHKPTIKQTQHEMADGGIRTQWSSKVTQHYDVKIDGVFANDVSYLKQLRFRRTPVWFIDGIAYETNAMPYFYSATSAQTLTMANICLPGEQYQYIDSVDRPVTLPGGTMVDSALTTHGGLWIDHDQPNFPNTDYCWSGWFKGDSTTSATINGQTQTTGTTGWKKLVFKGKSPSSGAFKMKLTNVTTFTGFQLTWGSQEEKPYSVGMGCSRAVIGDVSHSHVNLVNGMLTPVSFTVDEVTR